MKPRLPLHQRIAGAIRRRREGLGISQEAFADRIGMHRASYGLIERGKKDIRLSTLDKVCEGLGTKVSEIARDAEK